MKPKSYCIYHVPIDLEPNEMVNTIWFNLIRFREYFPVCKLVNTLHEFIASQLRRIDIGLVAE